ncbi:MAG: hypothetical protein HY000_05995 [Planctomycetes bacterium]|nr:hypothetical protein [Planctomycetota bacterium]
MDTGETAGPGRAKRFGPLSWRNAVWLVGYLAVVSLTLWLLFAARQWALAELARPEATAQWQAWRDAETERARAADAPVRRRVPKSAEPPALAILRDAFTGLTLGALAIVSVLYGFLVIVVRGTLR